MLEIGDLNDLEEFRTSRGFAVLVFAATAAYSGLDVHLARFERDFSLVGFARVNTDIAPVVAEEYDAKTSPTFQFFHNGKKINTVVGSDFPAIEKALGSLSRLPQNAPPAGAEWPIASPLNEVIDYSALELLNVTAVDPGSQASDLFGKGNKATVTDADSQLLVHIPFHNKVNVTGLLIQPSGEGEQPHHVRIFASLPAALSFEDAQTHKAIVDQDLPEASQDGWIELKVRPVLFQNVSSLLIFLTGEDDDEPIAVQRIVLAGQAKDRTQQASLVEAE